MFPEATPEDIAFIKHEEGVVPYVYDDGVYPTKKYKNGTKIKGNLTGGVGHLLSKGSNIFPEAKKWIGKDIPADVINKWLDDDLDVAEKAVADKIFVNLTSRQRGALISWTFNVGPAAMAKSTLVKKLNKGDYASVPGELKKWVKAKVNGIRVTLQGLEARRTREGMYFLGGTPAYTEGTEPKATEIAENPQWGPTEIVGGGTVAAGVATAGFTTDNPFLAYVFGGLLIVGVLLGVAYIVKRTFFK